MDTIDIAVDKGRFLIKLVAQVVHREDNIVVSLVHESITLFLGNQKLIR
jgi:hypothetical protein